MSLSGPGFKIGDAYRFAAAQGLDAEAQEIRDMAVHPSLRKPHVLRKAAFVELFEARDLMPTFAERYWPARGTEFGEQRRQLYLDAGAQNRQLLSGETPDEDAMDQPGGSDIESPSEAELVAFAMEAQLRDFIIENLSRIAIGSSRVRLYMDPNGRAGREYPTEVGLIDILAVDDTGDFIVFELKLDRGPDRTLGQLLRYMGWIKVNLAGERPVRGVIVARSIDSKLRYGARIVPNVLLMEYDVAFSLREVGLLSDAPGS